jgi:hypothetical protein
MAKSGYGCVYCGTSMVYVHEIYCPRYSGSKRAKKAIDQPPQKPQEKR